MSKTRTNKRRAKRRANHEQRRITECVVEEVTIDEFQRMFTEKDRRLQAEAVLAEQQGDIAHALSCLSRTPRPLGSPWERQLVEMNELGADAEPWQWARFTVGAAGRWIRSAPIPLVARVVREVTAAAEGVNGQIVPDYPGWVAGRAALYPAIEGMLLFDELMLEVFLVQCAPVLAQRGGGGRDWAQSTGRVYQLVAVDGVELQVRGHGDGQTTTVRHLGELVGLSLGDLVYGHVIDVPGDPGFVFAAPPIVVDEMTAQRLERAAEARWEIDAWCGALGAAVRSGDPHDRPSLVFDDEPGPRVRKLMDDGLERAEAEQLASVEVVLLAHDVTSASAPVGAFHAGLALADRRVYEEVRRRYTRPEHEAAWRSLATACHGLERARFLKLADASRVLDEAS